MLVSTSRHESEITLRQAAAHTIRHRLRDHGRARSRSRQAEARSLAAIGQALSDGLEHGLTIKEMAGLAGITRQTAYSLLERQGGTTT
jgi:hypothetical protein